MDVIVFLSGMFVITSVCTYGYLRSEKRKHDAEVDKFAATVPAPLTPEVREWLAPQLARRNVYPIVIGFWAVTGATIVLGDRWQEPPWGWFATLVGFGFGVSAGSLIAGYRTVPLVEGSVRTADPARRRVSDHYDRTRLWRLRSGTVLAILAVAFACATVLASDTATAKQALACCVLGAVLVGAYYWVAATVISRPMVASTPDGLRWQKAVLARTVDPMPDGALVVALFSVGIAVFAAVAERRDLPLALLVAGTCLALLGTAVAAGVLWTVTRSRRHVPRPAPSESVAP